MQLLPRPLRQKDKPSNRKQQIFKQQQLQNVKKISTYNNDRERITIFINSWSLFAAAARLNVEIDYNKLLYCLVKRRKLLRAYFYMAINSTNKQHYNFVLQMRRQGYRVITKELVQRSNGSEKANLDIEIAVDMLTLSSYCNTFVLLGVDDELTYAVNTVANRGVQVEVVRLDKFNDEELASVADCYINFAEIKQYFQKECAR